MDSETFTAPKKPVKCYTNKNIQQKQTVKVPKVDTPENVPCTPKKAVEFLLEGTLKTKLCRYCLNITSSLSDLGQIVEIASNGFIYSVTIEEMVASFHPVKVVEDPNLPNSICDVCFDKTVKSYLFSQQCEQSERALRNCLSDIYDKLEKLDPLQKTRTRGRQKIHINHNILYTEHEKVIDYAQPIMHLVSTNASSITDNNKEINKCECLKCWQVLPDYESLANHEKIHPNTMWFSCRLCGKSFQKRYHIKRHIRNRHSQSKNIPPEIQNGSFKCYRCGFTTNNYHEFQQHVENHKFKKVLEHIIEGKMDDLCTVCYENDGKMVGLNEEVLMHGGYPDLSGKKSMFEILGSTLPERKSHKYQQLILAEKASIMTIVKKSADLPKKRADNAQRFALPIIIAKDKKFLTEFFIYFFNEPQYLLETECKIPNELGTCDENKLHKETFSIAQDSDVIQYQDKTEINTPLFIFSKPLLEINEPEIIDFGINKQFTERTAKDRNKQITWIFDQSVSKESEYLNFKLDSKEKPNILGNCKFCWIFKSSSECDICKNINKDIKSTVENTASVESAKLLRTEKSLKRKQVEIIEEIKPKELIWQCNVCLSSNTSVKMMCGCCDATNPNYATKNLEADFNFHETSSLYNIKSGKDELECDPHRDVPKLLELNKNDNENIINLNDTVNYNKINNESKASACIKYPLEVEMDTDYESFSTKDQFTELEFMEVTDLNFTKDFPNRVMLQEINMEIVDSDITADKVFTPPNNTLSTIFNNNCFQFNIGSTFKSKNKIKAFRHVAPKHGKYR